MEQFDEFIVPLMMGISSIILLIAGGRLLKSAIGFSAAMFGAGVGLLVAPSLLPSVHPFIIAGLFAAFCAVMAVLIAKFVIIAILGVGFAVATPVAVWHFASYGDMFEIAKQVAEAANEDPVESASPEETADAPLLSTEEILNQAFGVYLNSVTSVAQDGVQRINNAWEVIPAAYRLKLVGCALVGLLVGLLIATFMPFTSSAIVTSIGGSFVLFETAKYSLMMWSSDQLGSLHTTTTTVIVIVSLAFVGLLLQLLVFNDTQPKAKPAKKK
ncbi:MAG: hypothetical protein MK073_03325 [Phycisphaerales bacterium]|nr:hypothetical protein [Phycisphaerales bacterium]